MAAILYTRTGDAWKRFADKSKSVSNELMQILNLGFQQALNTLLVRQGEVAQIANARPGELRDLIVRVYNIELLHKMSDHLKSLELDLETRISIHEADFTPPKAIEDEIERIEKRIKDHKLSFKSHKADAKATKTLLKEMPNSEGLAAIQLMTQDTERAEQEYKSHMRYRDSDLINAGLASADMEVVRARLKTLKKEIKRYGSSLKTIKAEITEVDRKLGAIDAIAKDLREKIEVLENVSADDDSGIAECPTCSKPLSNEERERLLTKYQQKLKQDKAGAGTLTNRREALSEELRSTDERLSDFSNALDAVRRIKEKQNDVDRAEKRLEKQRAKLADAIEMVGVSEVESLLKKHKAKSILELQERLNNYSKAYGNSIIQCNLFRDLISKEQLNIKDAKANSVKMSELEAEIGSLKSLNEHTKYVRLKLVSGFVADYVVQKRLLGIIKDATNQYVRAFTNNQYTGIDLVSTTARGRSGSGLLLKIHDQRDDATKKTTQLSFGDRTAVSLGLRLGISRTMSSIRPLRDSPSIAPRIRCVMLDEPLGGLDKSRRASVVSNLVNDQSFEQILLITHTDIQGWDDVPAIEVSKSGSAAIAKLLM
jgi:DNA repair exonuclease SbcCD ATPase subunit